MKTIPKAAIGLALALIFWLFAEWFACHFDYRERDFFAFWQAGYMVLTGRYIYSSTSWLGTRLSFRVTWLLDDTSLYPLPLASLFAPLGAIHPERAFVLWIWLSAVMLLIAVALLMTAFGRRYCHYIAPVAFGVLLFRPLFSLPGQLGALLLVALVASAALFHRRRDLAGGALFSIIALKPSLGLPLIVLFSFYLLVNRRYRAIGGVALMLGLLLTLSLAASPHWLSDYASVLQGKNSQTFGYAPTLWGLVSMGCSFDRACTMRGGSIGVGVVLVLYALLVMRFKDQPATHAMGLATATTLLVTPYLWPYDQILLTLPISLTAARLAVSPFPYLVSALYFLIIDLIAFVLMVITVAQQVENVNALLTLLVLILLVLTHVPSRARTPAVEVA